MKKGDDMTQSTKKLTMGSLFDGISGFPLASVRCGIEPIWASEIEPFPILVKQCTFTTRIMISFMCAISSDIPTLKLQTYMPVQVLQ